MPPVHPQADVFTAACSLAFLAPDPATPSFQSSRTGTFPAMLLLVQRKMNAKIISQDSLPSPFVAANPPAAGPGPLGEFGVQHGTVPAPTNCPGCIGGDVLERHLPHGASSGGITGLVPRGKWTLVTTAGGWPGWFWTKRRGRQAGKAGRSQGAQGRREQASSRKDRTGQDRPSAWG